MTNPAVEDFDKTFAALTGHKEPLRWQRRLYERLLASQVPASCDIPTGLGKTGVVAVWLIALARHPDMLPRRLIYVVNRRTVVDQTTTEVEKLRTHLKPAGLHEPLSRLCAIALGADNPPLAISTLRGQFADNREWSDDPSRPAVICGTVDMIGSRLLFSGYRIGFKSRPLHAGFLGQDALLVHDEAHLEPAFQQLIDTIEREQKESEKTGHLPWRKLRVMALSATARENDQRSETRLALDADDHAQPTVRKRITAKKELSLLPCPDERKRLALQIAEGALETHRNSDDAILIFVRKVEDVGSVVNKLTDKKIGVRPDRVCQLTGTMRGHERDELVRHPAFIRFLPNLDRPGDVDPAEGTVYLVCTSAGEVGVNLSADHVVCDLSTFDSMAQRLGRVNRFGDRNDTRVDVVHPESFDDKKPDPQRKETLALLKLLNGDASPKALGKLMESLTEDQRKAAFAPEPEILPASDILFDAWALTTIRDKMPGRPPVAPYLHGVAEWEPPRTSVAWRNEVELITDELLARHGEQTPQELLDDYPLKPHELLSDTTSRIFSALQQLAARDLEARVWIVDKQGQVAPAKLRWIADPAAKKKPDRQRLEQPLEDAIVLLPPRVGGLTDQGTFDGKAVHKADHPHGYDVADLWHDENRNARRKRTCSEEPQPADAPQGMALIRTIDTNPLADEMGVLVEEGDEDSEAEDQAQAELDSEVGTDSGRGRFWHWFTKPRDAENATNASIRPIPWRDHTDDVVKRTTNLVDALNLPDDLKKAVILSAELHDLGKKREQWQRGIGNPDPGDWYAKPGKPVDGAPWRPRYLSPYRHEFGSLLDVVAPDQEHLARLEAMPGDMRDVVLHLIAAHHGYARPNFPPETTVDPDHPQAIAEEQAVEAMRRYARLQRRYGRWGLAYLESLLRAADWAASANPSENGGDA